MHFHYIKPNEDTCEVLDAVRSDYQKLLTILFEIPESRERGEAIKKLEESLMFCTKAIVVAPGAGE